MYIYMFVCVCIYMYVDKFTCLNVRTCTSIELI